MTVRALLTTASACVLVTVSCGSSTGSRDTAAVATPGAGPYRVVKVVDGDTIKVAITDTDTETIRLIGINTPETVDPRRPVECFGREASARAHEILDDTSVTLEADPSQDAVDRYGRTLAFVWTADGRLFNEVMIAEGYAFEYTYDVPYKYQARFIAAQRAAREAELGLWANGVCEN